MSKLLISGIAFLCLIALVLNQNCAQLDSGRAFNSRTQNYDQANLATLAATSSEEKTALCQTLENYECVQRFYRPGVAASDTVERVCFLASGGETCLDMRVLNYNTDSAFSICSGCTEADRAPGGRYNYEESRCVNKALFERTGIEDRFEAGSIAAAFDAARDACDRLLNR